MIAASQTRGYAVLYRAPQVCPSCARGHWLVGRSAAECAFCGTALALAPVDPNASPELFTEDRA